MVKIWLWKKNIDMILFHSDTCTQKYVEENYQLIAETDTDLENWFQNFNLNGRLYDVHAKTSYKDTDYKVQNIFALPYTVRTLKDIKQNPQIENINNAICPACGYVDYDCWENDCPDENYRCPQCKSHLLLEHRFEQHFDGYTVLYQRTTFKNLHHPPKIQAVMGKIEC